MILYQHLLHSSLRVSSLWLYLLLPATPAAIPHLHGSPCRHHILISGKTLLESSDLERLMYGISQAGRGAQAWRSPSHDKGASSEACYLEIRLLSLILAFRPHPEMVKLKYGNTQTPLSGETQVWNPSDLVSSSMASPRLSSSSPTHLAAIPCYPGKLTWNPQT